MSHDDATGWFEPLYASAADGRGVVPWDARQPDPALAAWLPPGEGRRAVVVGCGLGDDADVVASSGWATTAFDVAPTAIRLARERFPDSAADFVAGDLLAPDPAWVGAFDLVVEHFTVQALPVAIRPQATAAVAALLAPGGTLVVVANSTRDDAPDRPGPPWRMTRADIDGFAAAGLVPGRIDGGTDAGGEAQWFAVFTRPG